MIHIVLFEPEIPQNTGNIMRTAMASLCHLHIIEPTGFTLDDKRMRRSVMDYDRQLNYTVHATYEAFLETMNGELYFITRYGQHCYSDVDFKAIKRDIYIMFGKESTGIPKEILQSNLDHCLRIPMVSSARSLNLSNCVALVDYEIQRQLGFPDLSPVEVLKGADWINR